MNDVERLLLEQMDENKFQSTINDDFDFVDSLIDDEEEM